MYSIQFWNDWPPVYRRIFWGCISIFLFSFIFLWISYLLTPAPTINTEHFQQLEIQEVVVNTFALGDFDIAVPADNYLVFERMMGGPLQPNLVTPYLFVSVLVVFMIIALAIISTLSRFWYFIGMGLFILFVVSFRIEAIGLFDLTNKIPTVCVLVIYGGQSFYFQAFNTSISFLKRLLIISVVTAIISSIFYFFASAQQPFLHLAANGIAISIILSILFIFIVAIEIPAAFILIITRSIRPTKSLRHFLILSAIYLINLGLAYAEMKGFIRWNFLTINFFLLLTLSALLGLWGFRQRELLYENILRANPFGVYLYIGLASVCFFSIGYFLSTANDPALQILKDSIIYSHIGYGIIFFAYVLANFTPMLAKNFQVYKILYKPNNMPYFTLRLAGLIATFAFFAYSNWRVSVSQVFAGYYNAYADVYFLQGESQLAESFYRRSAFYVTRNHHAHYALANIEEERFEYQKEKDQYTLAADTRPTELSYLNLSQAYERDDALLESALALNQGLNDFPESGILKNALGLIYGRLHLRDSALLMLNEARSNSSIQSEAEVNLIGLSAKFNLAYPADSLFQLMNNGQDGPISNALALANVQQVRMDVPADLAKDTVLTLYKASFLNNYILNHLDETDSILLSNAVMLARKPSNAHFKDGLLFSAAHAYYASGQVAKGFKLLREIAFLNQNGKYYNVLGLWALQQGDPEIAQVEFNYALKQNYKPALINMAFALSENKKVKEALVLWDSIRQMNDTTQARVAQSMINILTTNQAEVKLLTDREKYQYLHFNILQNDSSSFNEILASIKDEEYKAKAMLERSKQLWKADELTLASQQFSKIVGLKLRDESLYQEILHFNLQLLAAHGQWDKLTNELNKGITFAGHRRIEKFYYETKILEQQKNDKVKKSYEWLSTCNPYLEESIISSIRFFHSDKDKLKSFNLLVEALTMNPGSVKLLKAYTIESAKLGFSDYAQSTLDTLKTKMSPSSFTRFIKENPEIFEVTQN